LVKKPKPTKARKLEVEVGWLTIQLLITERETEREDEDDVVGEEEDEDHSDAADTPWNPVVQDDYDDDVEDGIGIGYLGCCCRCCWPVRCCCCCQ